MATTKKKTTAKSSKKASAPKAAKTAAPKVSAVESNVHTPDQIVHAGTDAVKDFLSASTEEAQKAQEQAFSFGQEHMEKWAETTDRAVQSISETFAVSQEHVDAVMESSKIATDLGKDLHERFVAESNAAFSENLELTKELLTCQTIDDVVDVQNRAMHSNMSRFFEQSARLTDAWFKLATDATEPMSAQANAATSRLSKKLAA